MVLARKKSISSADQVQYLGRRVKVFWEGDCEWFSGIVAEIKESKKRFPARIVYDDDDFEWGKFIENGAAFSVPGAKRPVEWPAEESGAAATDRTQGSQGAVSADTKQKADIEGEPERGGSSHKRASTGAAANPRGGKTPKTDAAQKAPKRGRGRPKKQPNPEPLPQPSPTPQEDTVVSLPAQEGQAGPQGRKRLRQKRTKENPLPKTVTSPSAEQEKASAVAQEDPTEAEGLKNAKGHPSPAKPTNEAADDTYETARGPAEAAQPVIPKGRPEVEAAQPEMPKSRLEAEAAAPIASSGSAPKSLSVNGTAEMAELGPGETAAVGPLEPHDGSSLTPAPGLGLLDQLSHIDAPSKDHTPRGNLARGNHSLDRAVSAGPLTIKITRIGSSRAASAPVGREAVEENLDEIKERCVHLGSMLEVLTRTRDSIGETTNFLLSGAKCGGASALIKTVVRRLEAEPNHERRVDFLYLIDSTVQRSVRPGKAELELEPGQPLTGPLSAAGHHFPAAVGALLNRIVTATGSASEDGAKKVEKVLNIWKARSAIEGRHVDAALQKLHSSRNETARAPSKATAKDAARQCHGVERQPRRRNQSVAVTQAKSIGVSEYGSTATLLMLLGCTEGLQARPGTVPTPAAVRQALATGAPTMHPFRVPPWIPATATEDAYHPSRAAELHLQLCEAQERGSQGAESPESQSLGVAPPAAAPADQRGHERDAGEVAGPRPPDETCTEETSQRQGGRQAMHRSPGRQQPHPHPRPQLPPPASSAIPPPPLPLEVVQPPLRDGSAQYAAPSPPPPLPGLPPPLPDTAPPPLPDGSPPPLPGYSPPPLPDGSPPPDDGAPGYSPPPVKTLPRRYIVQLEPPHGYSPSRAIPQGYSPVSSRAGGGRSPPSSYQALQPSALQQPRAPGYSYAQLAYGQQIAANANAWRKSYPPGPPPILHPPEPAHYSTPPMAVQSLPVEQWPGQLYTPHLVTPWTQHPLAPMPTPEPAMRTPAEAPMARLMYPPLQQLPLPPIRRYGQ